MIIDYDKVNEFRGLDTAEAKLALEEYGLQFGINLRRNKSFDNMLGALERHVEENFAEDSISDENDSDSAASSVDSTIDESEEAQDEISEEEPSEGPAETVEVGQEQTEETPLENEDTGVEADDEKRPEEVLEFPENFHPTFSLAFYNNATGTRFAQVGYWITDEISKLGKDWKRKAESSRYPRELKTVIYYIQKYGSVTLRESRNGRFIKFD